ncbi:transposase IS4 family protein [Desulfatibacillum aliphaticivorans]|uniref:Transposase IS4 family protein n=1 Tax=Desulfatibacillum aliphaticivorans TaxID=218208 RepID=B8FD36_DESAL|nr:transposase [Desulfatibacillum aliphaticivorans]ACL06467.1 transposase IS4 family protein [Desulfatibacillum aliphaticivorans]
MMNKAKGPVWHKKQKEQGVIPAGLRGVDQEATWCKSHADGWVYGHGSFSLTNHNNPVLGCFLWMPNSGNEAKRLWLETGRLKGLTDYVSMDSKADSYPLFRELKRQRDMILVTSSRRKVNKTPHRIRMHQLMQEPELKQIYKERSYRVEPMQGLVKDIFELDTCWMRGRKSNRWLFAAMGLAVQMHQLVAYKENRSTWKIKQEVLG